MSCYLKNLNTELERAVLKGDLENVRALLNRGADVNLEVEWPDKATLPCLCTLLHISSSVEVTKELLLRGAKVDRTNKYRETPLDSATSLDKGLKLVKELLKHGADVNAINRKGNTPLSHAVKRSGKNLEGIKVVKVLLEYGADINIRNRERGPYDFYSTPLDKAAWLDDPACAKLLIKITLIKNVKRDYRKIVDLSPYKECKTYSELSRYLDDCVCEILQMKTDKVNDNLSLYEFVIIKSASIKTLHACNKIADQVILTNYPIYYDMISDKVKLCLERASLLNKLSELQIYMRSDISNQDVKEKEVILNFDCTYNIAKYLPNDDLLNLVTAFYKHAHQSLDLSENLVESSQRPDTKLDEVSESSCAKRARLESPHNA